MRFAWPMRASLRAMELVPCVREATALRVRLCTNGFALLRLLRLVTLDLAAE